MTTRYTLISSVYGPMMDKSKKGEFVLFEDYERLNQDYLIVLEERDSLQLSRDKDCSRGG